MKRYIRPPKKEKETKDDDKKNKKEAKTQEEVMEHQLEFVDDRDMDFSILDNVSNILNKYKNQQISRRNFDPNLQIEVLQKILTIQTTNKNVQIEVLMILMSTYFASAKNSPTGFFSRETWLTTNTTFTQLLKLIKTIKVDTKK